MVRADYRSDAAVVRDQFLALVKKKAASVDNESQSPNENRKRVLSGRDLTRACFVGGRIVVNSSRDTYLGGRQETKKEGFDARKKEITSR